jgi:hypothetical protein
MSGQRQFSLSYLFVETFWIALAIAATRAAVLDWAIDVGGRHTSATAFLVPIAVWSWLIAIGGLFGRMTGGAVIGFVLFWPLALLLANYY